MQGLIDFKHRRGAVYRTAAFTFNHTCAEIVRVAVRIVGVRINPLTALRIALARTYSDGRLLCCTRLRTFASRSRRHSHIELVAQHLLLPAHVVLVHPIRKIDLHFTINTSAPRSAYTAGPDPVFPSSSSHYQLLSFMLLLKDTKSSSSAYGPSS